MHCRCIHARRQEQDRKNRHGSELRPGDFEGGHFCAGTVLHAFALFTVFHGSHRTMSHGFANGHESMFHAGADEPHVDGICDEEADDHAD